MKLLLFHNSKIITQKKRRALQMHVSGINFKNYFLYPNNICRDFFSISAGISTEKKNERLPFRYERFFFLNRQNLNLCSFISYELDKFNRKS